MLHDYYTKHKMISEDGESHRFNYENNEECYLMEGSKEMFYLTMHSTHFIYGYMVSDIGKGPLR